MQPNRIELKGIDINGDNSSSGDVVYTRFEEHPHSSLYISGDDLPDSRERVQLYRTLPKQSGNFRGNTKSKIKLTRDAKVLSVAGNEIVLPIIAEMSFSLPLGATPLQIRAIRKQMIAVLSNDELCQELAFRGQI